MPRDRESEYDESGEVEDPAVDAGPREQDSGEDEESEDDRPPRRGCHPHDGASCSAQRHARTRTSSVVPSGRVIV